MGEGSKLKKEQPGSLRPATSPVSSAPVVLQKNIFQQREGASTKQWGGLEARIPAPPQAINSLLCVVYVLQYKVYVSAGVSAVEGETFKRASLCEMVVASRSVVVVDEVHI